MYANYLIDVGKLVFIVGEPQTTSQFRNLFMSGGSAKEKIFYKTMQEIPADTFKKDKVTDQRKGIIKKDWFNKILNRNPEMIVMTFNCSPELALWEDRLKVIIKKINRVYDLMRSNNKQQVRLRIIVLISKHTFGGVNLHQKITNFLKTYEKELFIIQLQYYAKELVKLRSQWVYALQKNYDNKYKKIEKRRDETVQERRLGCTVKMAILSEILTKKDERQRYKQAYKAIKTRFLDSIKSVTILNHNKIRQLRAVSDVVFLRYLKCEMSATNISTKYIFDLTFEHMNFFKLKNLGLNETNKYFYYEELLWRCTFIESFLQLLYKNDLLVDDKTIVVSLCQLLNEVITYLYALGTVNSEIGNEQKSLGAKELKDINEEYVGLVTYKAEQLAETDIVYTFLSYLTQHCRDFLSKGIQLILRYKTMNVFFPYQLLFLNNYLLKFYIGDNKLANAMTIFQEVFVKQNTLKNNFYLANVVDAKTIHKMRIQAMAVLVCDYFEHQTELQRRLQQYFSLGFDQIQNTGNEEILKLKKNSGIGNVVCDIENQFVYIEDMLVIKLRFVLSKCFNKHGVKITVKFNHEKLNQEILLEKGFKEKDFERLLKIKPIDIFSKEETVQIEGINLEPLGINNVKFVIPNNHINFSKHSSVKIFTNLKCPQVDIILPHPVFYINQITHFSINIQKLQNFNMEAKFSIKEEDFYGKTQVFADLNQKINLTNCNYYQQLNTNSCKFMSNTEKSNLFLLKCNKLGEKFLKLTFHFTLQKSNSSDLLSEQNQSSKNFKQTFTVTRQLKFNIKELFNISKSFQQFSNDDNRVLQGKNIPVSKKILGLLELTADENILIKELGQHKNPKKVIYLKEIQKRDFILKKSTKLKLNSIFQLPPDCADQIELFLSSLYIKWVRIESSLLMPAELHQNIFLDQQVKINCFTNELSLFLRGSDNFLFKKNELNKLSLFVKNNSKNKYHVFAVLEGNGNILRVGEKGKEILVDSGTQKSLQFDVLPIVSGFLQLPTMKVFVDGVERNLNLKNGQVIKCF